MSLSINFEPHSWYMGFAIQATGVGNNDITNYPYNAYTDNGMTGYIDEVHGVTVADVKAHIRDYHLRKGTGYGEKIARNRLNTLREYLNNEGISYGQIAELQSLTKYIDAGDVQLLEAAGVPENAN